MKITFISNFLNHHQIPLCGELQSNADIQFQFIATEQVPQERIALGYQHEFEEFPYYREIGEDFTKEAAEQLCYESDVVIIGSASKSYIRRRLKKKKLTFLYSERFFKDGFWKHPGDVWRTFMITTVHRFKPLFVLCASAYTAPDCRRVWFGGKTLKWGYFPKTIAYNREQIEQHKDNKSSRLLWVGRMLSWKHPEIFLNTCKRLKDMNIPFVADMIGIGELEIEILRQIDDNNLRGIVTLHGSMSPNEVRAYMEKANVFVFTSNFREGWGAVLNEAMNSACAVIACDEAGSPGFLINHGSNGLVYHGSSNEEAVFNLVRQCVEHPEYGRVLGTNAYHTIHDMWNAQTAAKRLYDFSYAFLNGIPLPKYEQGPMSKA